MTPVEHQALDNDESVEKIASKQDTIQYIKQSLFVYAQIDHLNRGVLVDSEDLIMIIQTHPEPYHGLRFWASNNMPCLSLLPADAVKVQLS